jgi:hypothetical protein
VVGGTTAALLLSFALVLCGIDTFVDAGTGAGRTADGD